MERKRQKNVRKEQSYHVPEGLPEGAKTPL